MRRTWIAAAAVLVLLLAAMVLKGQLLVLPQPPAAQAPDGFDADRALARLETILGDQPAHPVDSPESDAIRTRLAGQMQAVGLTPRETDDFACNQGRGRFVGCARVRNLVATIGPAEGEHVLLSAHYDSTHAGPGAADAGIAVASLLETAALLQGTTLKRPVSFLFNEGEEAGLIGARAFLERDPLAPRIGSLINIEARGVEGPAIMFETSRPNAPAIAHFARASDRPVANSLTTDLYGMIPNSTDVAVFEDEDWTILNFAVIGNESRYHSPGDTLDALDRSSLQHMGEQTLAATLSLAAGEPVDAEGSRLYADFLGLQLIVLPLLFGLVLLGILFLFFAMTAWRRGAAVRSLGALAAAVAASALLAWAGAWLVGELRGGAWWRGSPWVGFTAIYATTLLAGVAALAMVAGETEPKRLRAWYWFGFVAFGALLSWAAPGAAIFFLFPPLVAGLGIVAGRRWPGAERIGGIAAALLLFLSFGPALALMEELLSNGPIWIFAVLGAAVALPFLIEAKPLLGGAAVRIAALLLAGAWTAAALVPAYSDARPQRFTIEYLWDADERQAMWAVRNDSKALPEGFAAAGAWERTELPYSKRKRWAAEAPDREVPAPAIEPVASHEGADGRRVRLQLRTNGAETIALVAPADSELVAAGAPGFVRRFGKGGAEDRYVVTCEGRSCEGAAIELLASKPGPIELMVVGMRRGLPQGAEPLLESRPARAHPQYGPDGSYAVRRFRI